MFGLPEKSLLPLETYFTYFIQVRGCREEHISSFVHLFLHLDHSTLFKHPVIEEFAFGALASFLSVVPTSPWLVVQTDGRCPLGFPPHSLLLVLLAGDPGRCHTWLLCPGDPAACLQLKVTLTLYGQLQSARVSGSYNRKSTGELGLSWELPDAAGRKHSDSHPHRPTPPSPIQGTLRNAGPWEQVLSDSLS